MLTLIRDQCGPTTSIGYIDIDILETSAVRIYTLERPWLPHTERRDFRIPGTGIDPRDGQQKPATATWNTIPPCGLKGRSCIPPGLYDLVPHDSEDHPDSFALVNELLWVYHHEDDVPEWKLDFARTEVLIHPANYVGQLRGCIAPGLSTRDQCVWNSRDAYDLLRPHLAASKQIEIKSL